VLHGVEKFHGSYWCETIQTNEFLRSLTELTNGSQLVAALPGEQGAGLPSAPQPRHALLKQNS